jgi:type VI secretion system protein ImpC
MADRSEKSSVHLDVNAASETAAAVVDPDEPFRILVLGDFSGRANRGVHAPLAGRRPVPVDLDNFDEVMAGMGVSLRLPRVALSFGSLDDFHPDAIYESADVFRELADLRSRPPAVAEAAAQAAAATQRAASGGGLLDSMLAETEVRHGNDDPSDLAAFVKRVMAPHLEERPDKRKLEWASRVDAIAAEQMRGVLHHPQFQALEAAWRAVWLLTQKLDPDAELKVLLLDVTVDELIEEEPERLLPLFAPQAPWAAIVGNYEFGQGDDDAARLLRFGRLASRAQAPFLAGALPSSGEASREWKMLRQIPEAKWIGLAVPRFLLRLPYGSKTSATETFPFEEMPKSDHQAYLWGNAAFVCAYLLGHSFRKQGWELRPGAFRQLEGLPLHVYTENGQSELKPCAEVLMSEADAETLMEAGFMPLASLKNQDSVLLVRFQSIADPPKALPGRWAN